MAVSFQEQDQQEQEQPHEHSHHDHSTEDQCPLDLFEDHYSLGTTSTTLRFRSRDLRVLDNDRNFQLVLEESKDKREQGQQGQQE